MRIFGLFLCIVALPVMLFAQAPVVDTAHADGMAPREPFSAQIDARQSSKQDRLATIETLSGWDGVTSISSFGEPDTATYGQTFVVPAADTFFDSFEFFVDDSLNTDFVEFAVYLMAWDDGRPGATGSILWESGPLATTDNGGTGGLEQFVVAASPRIELVAGQKYVIFLCASNFFDGTDGTGIVGGVTTDLYPDGDFAFVNNGSNFDAVTTDAWSYWGTPDLAFELTFYDVVPVELQGFSIE